MDFGTYWRTGKYITVNNQHISKELSLSPQSEVLGYIYIGILSVKPQEISHLINEDYVIK